MRLKIEDVTISESLNISTEIESDLNMTDGKEIYVEQTGEVDDELSETSENPVQNKVITDALAGKVDKAQPPNTVLATPQSGQVQAMALGNALQIDGQSIAVKTVNEMEDSTLPMSAAGVHVIVGNIDALLKTI